jgi:hypothetical protein
MTRCKRAAAYRSCPTVAKGANTPGDSGEFCYVYDMAEDRYTIYASTPGDSGEFCYGAASIRWKWVVLPAP